MRHFGKLGHSESSHYRVRIKTAEKFTSSIETVKIHPVSETIQTKQLPSTNRRSQASEKARKPPCNWAGQRKRKRRNQDGACAQGRICEGGKFSTSWEERLTIPEKVHWIEREFWCLKRGRRGNSKGLVEGKMRSNLHRGLALPFCVPQPETLC